MSTSGSTLCASSYPTYIDETGQVLSLNNLGKNTVKILLTTDGVWIGVRIQ